MHTRLPVHTRLRKARDTLRILCNHPLARDQKMRTLMRYGALQVTTRVSSAAVVPFVEGTRLTLEQWDGRRADVAVGLFEFSEMAFVLHALRASSHFVDVGANIGLYTVLAGGVARASCLSLEPVPDTFAQLRQNIRLNGLEDLVDARNVGVGRESDTLQFTNTEGANNHVVVDGEGDGVEVPVRSLDDLIDANREEVMIVKIDVEGWEEEVLRGGQQVLSRSDPLALIIEMCEGERYGFDEATIDDRLREQGFAPVEYAPYARSFRRVERRPPVGNTIYVNDLEAFEARVEASPSYQILGQDL